MILREQIYIPLPPTQVWPWIEDPQKMMQWHPKFVEYHPLSDGGRHQGFRYKATFRMSGKDRTFLAEIQDYRAFEKWTVVFRPAIPDDKTPHDTQAVETYELLPRDGGTLVQQTVDMRIRVPWFLRGLIWFITRFGKATGPGVLEGLKNRCLDPAA